LTEIPKPFESSCDPPDERTWLIISRRLAADPENDVARWSNTELAAPGGRGESCNEVGRGRECVDSIDLRPDSL
jgi:hypothetical protein